MFPPSATVQRMPRLIALRTSGGNWLGVHPVVEVLYIFNTVTHERARNSRRTVFFCRMVGGAVAISPQAVVPHHSQAQLEEV